MQIPKGYTKLATVGMADKGNYSESEIYYYLNTVFYNGSTYAALKDNPEGAPSNDGINWKLVAQGASRNICLEEITFEEALKRSNIQNGDTLGEALGKIAKIYSDINNVAFSGSYNDLKDIPISLPANGGTAKNVSGIIAVEHGGTGANNQANARTNLGLGEASTKEVANNLTTTKEGSVLDARQGKQLLDKIESLEKRLGGLSFQMMTQAEFDSNPPKDKHVITIIDPEEE